MARPASNNPKVQKHVALSIENVSRMELELWSEVEGRVPVGAQGLLIDRLLTEYFQRLDDGRTAILTVGG
jgi:hypothetical protein